MVYMITASYIYTGVVISSNSVGLQNSASRLAKPNSHSTMAECVLESSLPQEEQVMHEGISTSKVSASLLQGNVVPIIT